MGRAQKLKQQRREEEAKRQQEERRKILGRVAVVAGIVLAVGITAGLVFLANYLKEKEKEPKITARMVLETSKGDIVIGLYGEEAPLTVQQMTDRVNSGFYDGLRWYRVEDFVVQTGSHMSSLMAEAGEAQPDQAALEEASLKDQSVGTIPDEVGLSNLRGMVGMAKPSDPETQQPKPNSATTDFYILKQDAPGLDPYFTVFGKVVRGMDVVDALEATDVLLKARME